MKYIKNNKFYRVLSFYGLTKCTYLLTMVNAMDILGYGKFRISEIMLWSFIYLPAFIAIKIGYRHFLRENPI